MIVGIDAIRTTGKFTIRFRKKKGFNFLLINIAQPLQGYEARMNPLYHPTVSELLPGQTDANGMIQNHPAFHVCMP